MRLVAFFVLALAGNTLWGSCAGAQGVQPVITDDLDRESLRLALQRSLDFLQKVPPQRILGEWPRKVAAQEIKESLIFFLRGLSSFRESRALGAWFNANFELFAAARDPGAVLFTGYYRPILDASLTMDKRHRFPIYGRPGDLVDGELVSLAPNRQVEKVVGRFDGDQWLPYFSRAEIDRGGSLNDKGYEIAWVDDPVELFFLHVQGSGLLRFADGTVRAVGYAASNGKPYRSIGKILADSGKMPMEQVTMQRLKRYLNDHPQEREALLDANERYVFFRFMKAGAVGSLDVPLTPGRSIATDARLFPKGALAFVATREPVLDRSGSLKGWKPLTRFVLNQDTGAAIQGRGRVDLYFGTGDQAGAAAGMMKSPGSLYFALAKRSAPRDPKAAVQ
jgi:membrane-bound lytic murein transglycosylase A